MATDVQLATSLGAFITAKRNSVELFRASPEQLARCTVLLLVGILDLVNENPATGPQALHELAMKAHGRALGLPEQQKRATSNQAGIADFIGVIALNAILLQRRLTPPALKEFEASEIYLRQLVGPGVGRALHLIYDPGREMPLGTHYTSRARASAAWVTKAMDAWQDIDPTSFGYHRAGTTSVILECEAKQATAGYPDRMALKCVLFPWTLTSVIADSTAAYEERYGRSNTVAVETQASSPRWVLMPFEDGPTLGEWVASRLKENPDTTLRIATAKTVAVGLANALDLLARGPVPRSGPRPASVEIRRVHPEGQHFDLSPSNVIVQPGAAEDEDPAGFRLLDLGPNHLYTRQVGTVDHDDAMYVAPEVKNRGDSPTSDLYSLAVVVTEILSKEIPRDGRVPDDVYETSPLLGRMLDDALESEPDRRLLLAPGTFEFGRAGTRSGPTMTFLAYTNYVRDTFSLVEQEPAAIASALERRWVKVSPVAGELSSLFKKLWEIRKSPREAVADHIGYLTLMSAVATTVAAFIWGKCAVFGFQQDMVDLEIPHLVWNAALAASLIGFSQGVVAMKFYQDILARLTARGTGHWLSLPTEIAIRATAVVALPTTVLAVMWRPELWAWTAAAGAGLVALTNYFSYRLAVVLSERGRAMKFTTVPAAARKVPGGYEQWWWTMLIYAFVIGVIAWGLQTGAMVDDKAYVFGLLVINFGIHYVSKCVIAGDAVRGGLKGLHHRRTTQKVGRARAREAGVDSRTSGRNGRNPTTMTARSCGDVPAQPPSVKRSALARPAGASGGSPVGARRWRRSRSL